MSQESGMQINNIVNGLLGFILGIFFVIAFGKIFTDLLGVADTESRIFLATIMGIILGSMLFFHPIHLVTTDDRGNSN